MHINQQQADILWNRLESQLKSRGAVVGTASERLRAFETWTGKTRTEDGKTVPVEHAIRVSVPGLRVKIEFLTPSRRFQSQDRCVLRVRPVSGDTAGHHDRAKKLERELNDAILSDEQASEPPQQESARVLVAAS